MTQDDSGYEMRPLEKAAEGAGDAATGPAGAGRSGAGPKPGEPGWVPPVPVVETAEEAVPEVDADVEKNKGMAILGYICFIVPLVAAPNSKYARYHANQGLLLFILLIAVCVVVALLQGGKFLAGKMLASIPVLDWFFACGLSLLQPALLVGWLALMIVGIIHAANGERKGLPGVGHWELIK